ncbi:Fic family protein [Komagataeibacter sp. FNDCR1]|nr:Fic family protein [Komagataeibacter sp. FNDCR1]
MRHKRSQSKVFRTLHIAYSTYNPPPPDQVAACLEASLNYMQADGMQQMTQSLITRLAIAHAHFEAVHPFSDGNGRVGVTGRLRPPYD